MKNVNNFNKIILLFVFICLLLSCTDIPQGISSNPVPNPVKYIDTIAGKPFVHEGLLHSQADFDRIKAKIAANAESWASGWNKLAANSHSQSSYKPNPVTILIRGGNSKEEPNPDNYSRAMNDAAAAYQLAIRWRITGEAAFANTAIKILNAWATQCTKISGDSNSALAAGLYGYQFAIAGELMRNYSGWNVNDFNKYKQWMLNVFYSLNNTFLANHFGTCPTHYWANWDLANLASVMAIGVLTDKRSLYNKAVNYLQKGAGNGNLLKAISNVYSDGLAQLQESGRDQGHATLCIGLIGIICEISWKQGDDFYGFDDNRYFKACEYTARFNVANQSVQFKEYIRLWNTDCRQEVYSTISEDGRGAVRPIWELPFNHYVKRKGISAACTQMAAQSVRPEGGGGDYGPNSGGFDQFGFGTLLYSLE